MLKHSYCPQRFAVRWDRGWVLAVGAPALEGGSEGRPAGLMRRSMVHKTRFHFYFLLGWWVTAIRDFGFICSSVFGFFLAGGGHCLSGEEVVRDERCFWQGVCSLLMSPEILDLVHLHPAFSLEGEGGYF